jgi:hypothetical protein
MKLQGLEPIDLMTALTTFMPAKTHRHQVFESPTVLAVNMNVMQAQSHRESRTTEQPFSPTSSQGQSQRRGCPARS